MMDRALTRRLPLLLLPLALFACGGEDAPTPDPVPPPSSPAEEAAASPMEEPEEVSIALHPLNESGVSGEAMGMHTDDAAVVVIELTGLPAEGEFRAHIHVGSCADPGAPTVTLNPVIGLSDGTGTSTTTVELSEVPVDEPHFIMVHGEGGAPIACGDMEGSEG